MKTDDLQPGYERVFTVTDYYDGPRKGIANYNGHPHFYECVFDEAKDDYSELFRLTPLDGEIFRLAIEDWQIWERWQLAFLGGKATMDSHLALPEDAARHAELRIFLEKSLVTDPAKAILRIGEFKIYGESDLPKGAIRPLQVTWIEPGGSSGSGP